MLVQKFGFRLGDRVEEFRGFDMEDIGLCKGTWGGSGRCIGKVVGFDNLFVLIKREDGFEGGGINGAWLSPPEWLRKIDHEIYFTGDTIETAAVESGWKPDELDRDKYDEFMRNL